MAEIIRDKTRNGVSYHDKAEMNVWFCERCQVVHLKAGQTTVSLDREEFTDLTNAVMEIYCCNLRWNFGTDR